jgi:hypothetical protein
MKPEPLKNKYLYARADMLFNEQRVGIPITKVWITSELKSAVEWLKKALKPLGDNEFHSNLNKREIFNTIDEAFEDVKK